LRENHSGMETRSLVSAFAAVTSLRENHSGMETRSRNQGTCTENKQLRENHSGMETRLFGSYNIPMPCCVRTIVVWKHDGLV